jgi:lysophospholipase L1-like esterase
LGLLVAEILARLVTPNRIRDWLRPLMGEKRELCTVRDRVLDHRLKPHCEGLVKSQDFEIKIKTNSWGLREREIEKNKPEGVFRVLILGDSFAQGWGVDVQDRFSEQASRLLQAAGKTNIEIINAGVNSYSPLLEFEYLRNIGIEFDPDMVVVVLDWSDLHDDYFYGGWERYEAIKNEVLGSEEQEPEEILGRKPAKFSWWLDHSTLVKFLETQIKGRYLTQHHQLGWENLVTDILIYERALDWPDYDQAWNLPVANLSLMKNYLAERNIDFVVGLVPRGIFFADEWQAGRQLAGFRVGGAYDLQPVKMIEAKLKAKGIKLIDWYEPFLSSQAKPLFYDHDGHWTKLGHQLVGETLAKYLEAASQEQL